MSLTEDIDHIVRRANREFVLHTVKSTSEWRSLPLDSLIVKSCTARECERPLDDAGELFIINTGEVMCTGRSEEIFETLV